MPIDKAKLASKSKGLFAFLSFAAIGVVNTAVDFLVFSLLIYASWDYLLAQLLGYAAGVVNSYLMNSKITFRRQQVSGQAQQMKRALKFIVWNLLMLAISSLVLWIFVEKIELNLWFSKLFVILIVLIINFLGNKLWIFTNDK